MCVTTGRKPGAVSQKSRNDLCPCGSGKRVVSACPLASRTVEATNQLRTNKKPFADAGSLRRAWPAAGSDPLARVTSSLAHIPQSLLPYLDALHLCGIIVLQPRFHAIGIALSAHLPQLNCPMQGIGISMGAAVNHIADDGFRPFQVPELLRGANPDTGSILPYDPSVFQRYRLLRYRFAGLGCRLNSRILRRALRRLCKFPLCRLYGWPLGWLFACSLRWLCSWFPCRFLRNSLLRHRAFSVIPHGPPSPEFIPTVAVGI